ncbi:hypothetical protein HK103_006839 [Boothiomyces macroporosus]|uniref:Rab3 GTPase-activating protein catalytic subunit n=1 Tax=Boothiomyces macroporosus TaxID=261099 RepID=A0AAD5UCY1_9FUNG|nr:hypothetical protein HK103_006839 [Boothiomyces macroporosus]
MNEFEFVDHTFATQLEKTVMELSLYLEPRIKERQTILHNFQYNQKGFVKSMEINGQYSIVFQCESLSLMKLVMKGFDVPFFLEKDHRYKRIYKGYQYGETLKEINILVLSFAPSIDYSQYFPKSKLIRRVKKYKKVVHYEHELFNLSFIVSAQENIQIPKEKGQSKTTSKTDLSKSKSEFAITPADDLIKMESTEKLPESNIQTDLTNVNELEKSSTKKDLKLDINIIENGITQIFKPSQKQTRIPGHYDFYEYDISNLFINTFSENITSETIKKLRFLNRTVPKGSLLWNLAKLIIKIKKTEIDPNSVIQSIYNQLLIRLFSNKPIPNLLNCTCKDPCECIGLQHILLHQKISMINVCLKRRKDRESDLIENYEKVEINSWKSDASFELLELKFDGRKSKLDDDLYIPETQPPTVLTSDLIDNFQEELLSVENPTLLQTQHLESDIQSFKAANPNCKFIDFVKMQGNCLWKRLFDSNPPVPCKYQKPIFDIDKQMSMVEEYLEQCDIITELNPIYELILADEFNIPIDNIKDIENIVIEKWKQGFEGFSDKDLVQEEDYYHDGSIVTKGQEFSITRIKVIEF